MKKRTEFTGSLKSNISFDKNEIRKKILVHTLREAHRSSDIYDALIKEYYEEGCLTAAKYFEMLMAKECILYKNGTIRYLMADDKYLLLSLFDNCKMAEKAAVLQQSNGQLICTQLLLQCLLLLDKNKKKYNWILLHAFKIVIKVASKVCNGEDVSKEPLCHICYKFGIYLMEFDLEKAVEYLGKSFVFAQGTNWILKEETNDNKLSHFASVIAEMYSSALLAYANDIFSITPEKAIRQTQKALKVLTEAGIKRNRNLYIKSNLAMADFQLKAGYFEKCLSVLEYTINYITPYVHTNLEYSVFLSRYHHLKGEFFQCMKKYELALVELSKSLEIVRQLNMKHKEAIVLLDIAKIYIDRGSSQFSMAESCLHQSKTIFLSLNDKVNAKKTSFIMANLKAHGIQPMILDLIKFISSYHCDKYRLIRWKSLCIPFWRN